MRELISLKDEKQTQRLAAYLAVEAIETSTEQEDGEWIVWVLNDDDRDRAQQIAAEFCENPGDPRYESAERKVRHVLREAERLQKERNKKLVQLRKRWGGSWWHCYPATYLMIGISVAVVVLCTDWQNLKMDALGPRFCDNRESVLRNKLDVVRPSRIVVMNGETTVYFHTPPDFPKNLTPANFTAALQKKALYTFRRLTDTLLAGEIWRPVTPVFIHLSLLHILFNMMWLRALGTAVEYVRGTGRFICLCLLLAVTSNIAQLFWDGPFFGGMSGVVFGLIGYVWMKGKTQPHLGLGMLHQTLVFSVLWLVLCMGGAFGPIANAAHLAGFLMGIAIGSRQAIWKKLTGGSQTGS